jgi:hypothetical protein
MLARGSVGVLAIGTPLNRGSFEIEALLAGGGFGEVYLANQPAMRRKVAIKVLRPEVSRNPRVLALFERDARAAGALLHPNVLPVIDFGRDEDVGVHYLAMHYVPDGRTLKDVIGTPLPLSDVARFVEAIASALDAAMLADGEDLIADGQHAEAVEQLERAQAVATERGEAELLLASLFAEDTLTDDEWGFADDDEAEFASEDDESNAGDSDGSEDAEADTLEPDGI